nr:MAG TPA_asm: hypothetical protein [Caudoviricetes sp.]
MASMDDVWQSVLKESIESTGVKAKRKRAKQKKNEKRIDKHLAVQEGKQQASFNKLIGKARDAWLDADENAAACTDPRRQKVLKKYAKSLKREMEMLEASRNKAFQ